MAEDSGEKTEVYIYLNVKETSSFYYAQVAMTTKVKSLQDFVCSSRRY